MAWGGGGAELRLWDGPAGSTTAGGGGFFLKKLNIGADCVPGPVGLPSDGIIASAIFWLTL
jgi:hypothetical protein